MLQYCNWSSHKASAVGIEKKKVWNGCVELVKGKEQVLDGRVELSVVWLDGTMGWALTLRLDLAFGMDGQTRELVMLEWEFRLCEFVNRWEQVFNGKSRIVKTG